MKPTKVGETQTREFVQVMQKAQRPLEISEHTQILDVRSSFDYGLNHVQNSLYFPWENLAESRQSGEVLRNKHQAAQRLALLGLTPSSPVVIVGYGPAGKGEEGRLAWTLLYLGFQDVQISSVEALRKTMTTQATPPPQNVPEWPLHPREEMQIDKAGFLKWAHDERQRGEAHVYILDVRSPQEYLKRPEAKSSNPGIDAINIEWTEFFTPQGRPNVRFRHKLGALGISTGNRLLIVSNRGVRSAAVAYALLSLGYGHTQNFTGGWDSLGSAK